MYYCLSANMTTSRPGRTRIELHPSRAEKLPKSAGSTIASVSVSYTGEPVRFVIDSTTSDQVFARTLTSGRASFARTRTEHQYSALVTVGADSNYREIWLPDLTATFPIVESFPDGDILVVAPRCRYSESQQQLNAKVFTRDGAAKREFLLGDGIEHVQADNAGNIWVGYCDEGVYGNFGWEMTTALGVTGLSCFNALGEKVWDYQPPEGFESIADCYALNVSARGVWICYYDDFPIAFIDGSRNVRCWRNDSVGAKAIAVGDQRILLYGGYADDRTSCRLLQLEQSKTEQVSEVFLALPRGIDLNKCSVIGRENSLHVFSNDDWFVFSIDSLPKT
jgi:hypothetical protein